MKKTWLSALVVLAMGTLTASATTVWTDAVPLVSTECVQQSEEDNPLDVILENMNKQLPVEMANGMTFTKVGVENGMLVYVFRANAEKFNKLVEQKKMVASGKGGAGEEWGDAFVRYLVNKFLNLTEPLVKAGLGVNTRFFKENTKAKLEFSLTPKEVKDLYLVKVRE